MGVLKKPASSEMCPPGYHIVHGHERTCQSGTVAWVHTHLRRNHGKLADLRKENLLYLYWHSKEKFASLKRIFGFKKDDGELDSAIQFWLKYWQESGLKMTDMDPLLIKALIAVESDFNPEARSNVKGSSAFGIMQVTDQARRIMSGEPNHDGYREIRSDYLAVSKDDIADPVVNIAAGTRWLFHKYTEIPKGQTKDPYNTIKNYHSWDDAGKKYADSVTSLYQQSIGKKR